MLQRLLYTGKVWRIDFFQAYGERKFGEFNRSANRLLIVSTNLDGFSLANHGQSTKFAKLSRYTVTGIGMLLEKTFVSFLYEVY